MSTDSSGTDLGLFGPTSVAWRMHRDPIMWIAGIRALFLQALHPRTMWGVAQNSNFRDDPWGRLMRTSGYVARSIYGTVEEASRAGEAVRAIHRRLRAVDLDTGARYRVDEPALLTWVHCVQVDSFVSTGLRVGLISTAEADRYVAEQRRAAALVGLDPAAMPGSLAELNAYLTRMRPQLRATPEARATARFLLLPTPTQGWLRRVRFGWLPIGALALVSLPDWARAQYGAPRTPSTAAVTTMLRAARLAAFALPPVVRTRPEIRTALHRARGDRLRTHHGHPTGPAS